LFNKCKIIETTPKLNNTKPTKNRNEVGKETCCIFRNAPNVQTIKPINNVATENFM